MSELVRHDAGGESDGIADLMEVLSELTNERLFTMRTRQEEAVLRQRIE